MLGTIIGTMLGDGIEDEQMDKVSKQIQGVFKVVVFFQESNSIVFPSNVFQVHCSYFNTLKYLHFVSYFNLLSKNKNSIHPLYT